MTLYANGTEIESIITNGSNINEVYVNGIPVWIRPYKWSGGFNNVLLSRVENDAFDITVDILPNTDATYLEFNSDGTNYPCEWDPMYFDGITFQAVTPMANTEIKTSGGERQLRGNIGYFQSPGICQLQFGYTWCTSAQDSCDPTNVIIYSITGYVTYDPNTRTWSGASYCPNGDGDNYILRPVSEDNRYLELYFERTGITYGQIALGII